ncbi:MAG: M90 family metallopeptidase [Pseudomonadota bacterium]
MWLMLLMGSLLVLAWVLVRRARARARRATLLATRLPSELRALLERDVPLYARLPKELRDGVDGKIALFLDQVTFHGAGGLDVSEEMKLSIAAQASILVAANGQWYDTLRTVLLYPGAFRSRQPVQDGYVVTERDAVRIGESWERGPVILSWADSERGSFIDDDGKNVVLHEFAHQLDGLSGHTDGVPLLGSAADVRAWEAAFSETYERIGRLIEIGKRPFLDPYGASAPEELFPVATEAFFEQPNELRREEPDLYACLVAYYKMDPLLWPSS